MELLLAVALLAAVCEILWLKAELADLRGQIERDSKYYDWWMRSLEERKKDKPYVQREAEADEW